MTRKPRKVRLLSAESLVGHNELVNTVFNEAEQKNWYKQLKIHLGGSQRSLWYGVGFNSLQIMTGQAARTKAPCEMLEVNT